MSAEAEGTAARVVVVGSANVDVMARVPRIPAPGETLLATSLTRGPGGKGANQAVASARAGGADTWFVGRLGDDGDGELLRRSLAGSGVGVDAIETSSEPTGTALISVADDGENAIVVVGGANADFSSLSQLQRDRIRAADVVVAQLEIPLGTVHAAAQARRSGARFVLNAAPSQPLPQELLADVDVLVVNEHELTDLAGEMDPEKAMTAVARRVPALVVTLGARGSIAVERDRRTSIAAIPATPVDTTGAGDTFVGVLAARLAAGDGLTDAARWGSAAAALAVQRQGAQAAVPSAAEVAAVMGG